MQLAYWAELLAARAWCHIVSQRAPGLGKGVGATAGIECLGRLLSFEYNWGAGGEGVVDVSQPLFPVVTHICPSELWMLGHFRVLAKGTHLTWTGER